ncbi:hypothetical protein L1887_06098 [Cichorium endivia]|nr:hypothetical protein L1887_06098 [Cichorium endivia]
MTDNCGEVDCPFSHGLGSTGPIQLFVPSILPLTSFNDRQLWRGRLSLFPWIGLDLHSVYLSTALRTHLNSPTWVTDSHNQDRRPSSLTSSVYIL